MMGTIDYFTLLIKIKMLDMVIGTLQDCLFNSTLSVDDKKTVQECYHLACKLSATLNTLYRRLS